MKEVLTNFYYLCPRKILLDHKFNKFVNKTLSRNTMKKFAYLFAVLGLVCMFTACSSDDDPAIPGAGLPESKTYTATEGLTLQLDGANALGQEVSFERTQDSKANITIKGAQLDISSLIGGIGGKADATPGLTLPTASVIPGSTQVTIPVDLTGDANNCTFSGNSETEYCTFAYAGKVSSDALSLSITDVKLKNTSLAGTYNLLEFDDKYYNLSRLEWDSDKDLSIELWGSTMELPMKAILMMTLGGYELVTIGDEPMNVMEALNAVLKSVTLGEDGSVTAKYCDTKKAGLPETTSPKGIAQYVVTSNNELRLILNPSAIIADATKPKADADASTDITTILPKLMPVIEELLPRMLPMLSQGFPISYGPALIDPEEDNNMVPSTDPNFYSFYLNTNTLLPILKSVSPLLRDEEVVTWITNAASSTDDETMAGMAEMLPGVLKSLPDVIDSTTKIELGLQLMKQ